jgi:RHS repeat-associated protein
VTPEGSVSGTYDAQDRMLSYGPCSWSYDGHGDTQARTCSANRGSAAEARFPAGETRYRYDVFSNLRRVEMPDGRVIEYLIDGSNRRVGRLVNGQLTQRLIYKDQLEPIAEFDGAGQLKAWFIYADRAHVPTLMLKPENGSEVAYRLIADHLGSVRLVVRLQDGAVVQRIDYDEYGVVLSDSNPGFQPFGYAGGIDDREAGLVRFGARDYDPLTGRWLTKDRSRFTTGVWNLYVYVSSDALNIVDLDGRAEVCSRALNSGPLKYLPPFKDLRHDHIWYEDGTNSGFFDDDKVRPDYIDENNPDAGQRSKGDYQNCRYIGPDDKVRETEERVKKKMNTDWKLWFNDCQDYARAVIYDQDLVNERIRPDAAVNTRR